MKHNDYLKKYIVDQFDYLEYKKLVEIFINLIETLQITIGDYETGISITPNYELTYSGYSNKLSNSTNFVSSTKYIVIIYSSFKGI